jgi:hypothetical protein
MSVPRLNDLEQVKLLKTRYCRYLDGRQWDAMRALFTEDAGFEGLATAPPGATVDVFVTGLETRFQNAVSAHHVHSPEIVFFSDTRARGIWPMWDYIEWPEPMGFPGAPQARGFYGFGVYEEEYRKVGDVWKIAFVRLIRRHRVPLAAELPPFPGPTVPRGDDWLRG